MEIYKLMKWKKLLPAGMMMIILSYAVFAGSFGYDNTGLPAIRKAIYCQISGCTMEGDIDMGGYSIINVNYVNATYFNVTSVVLADYYNKTEIDTNFTNFFNGLADVYVPYTGATSDVDLGTHNLDVDDVVADDVTVDTLETIYDITVGDDVEIGGTLDVNSTSTFYDDVSIVNNSQMILEVETTLGNASAEIRVLADGTNDLYIYTYGSNTTGTFYGLPRGNTSLIDARGQRLIVGTFDDSPMYLATSRDPRWVVTADGDLIPFDDDSYDIGNYSERVRYLYLVGEDGDGGLRFVEDDESYGNLTMDDDFNLLWNGNIIVGSAGNVSGGDGLSESNADLRYLNLSGTNADQDIDIGIYNLTVNKIISKDWTNISLFSLGDVNNSAENLDILQYNSVTNMWNPISLEPTFFNASSVYAETGVEEGDISYIQVYDGVYYNVTEVGADIDFRVNFTGITSFSSLIIRHKTETEGTHISAIQIWDYNENKWEGYGYLTESSTSEIKTLGIYDDTDHIENGIVQVRFYLDDAGLNHKHLFDWVSISKGFGTPAGQEIDPYWNSEKGNYFNTSQIKQFYNNNTENISATYISNPPANCSSGYAVTGWQNNLSTTYCTAFAPLGDYIEDGDNATLTNLNITENIRLSGNITTPTDDTWGFFMNESCMFWGNLSLVDECCDGDC